MTRILALVAGVFLCWNGLASASMISVLDGGAFHTNADGGFEDTKIPDLNGFTGLDRANRVAGEHGQQGRDIAELHHAAISAPNRSVMSFRTDPAHLTMTAAIIGSPTLTNGTSITAGPFSQGSAVTSGFGMFSTGNGPISNGFLSDLTSQTVNSVAGPGGDPPHVLPEPTALLLLSSGLVGVWLSRLRKN